MNHDKELQQLGEAEIKDRLRELPGWEYEDNKLVKTFEFPTFNDGIALINQLVPFCNEIDHHPDIFISYTKITFYLTRYSIGGHVTDRDFDVAEKIEDLYGR